MSGYMFGCQDWNASVTEWIEAEILLHSLQHMGQAPAIKNYLDPNISDSEVDKPCPKRRYGGVNVFFTKGNPLNLSHSDR